MDNIGTPQFNVMCKMWGVDAAIKAAKRMGMTPSKDQIEAVRQEEQEMRARWDKVFKKKERTAMIKQDQEIFRKLRNVLTNCTTVEKRHDYLAKVEKANDISKTSEIAALIAERFWSIYPDAEDDAADVISYYQKRDALLRWYAALARSRKRASSRCRCEHMYHVSKMRYEDIIEHFLGIHERWRSKK